QPKALGHHPFHRILTTRVFQDRVSGSSYGLHLAEGPGIHPQDSPPQGLSLLINWNHSRGSSIDTNADNILGCNTALCYTLPNGFLCCQPPVCSVLFCPGRFGKVSRIFLGGKYQRISLQVKYPSTQALGA